MAFLVGDRLVCNYTMPGTGLRLFTYTVTPAPNKVLSAQADLLPTCLCRQEIADALEEVATASQQCSLLSQQHQAALSNPEPVVDQVRSHCSLLVLHHTRVPELVTSMSLLDHHIHTWVSTVKA